MTTAAKSPKKEPLIIQYYKDGEPISEAQNKISSIAWWHTKGIKRPGPLSAAEFRVLLKDLGVQDTNTVFDVTLPNGKRIHSTIGALVAPSAQPKKPVTRKAPTPTRAEKKANLSRLENTKLVAAEGELVKKWRDGGEVGPRPATPATDALGQRLEAKPNKGAAKATAVSKAIASNKRTASSKKPAAAKKAPTAKKPPAKKQAAKKPATAKKATAKKTPAKKGVVAPSSGVGPKPFRGPIPKPGAAKAAAS